MDGTCLSSSGGSSTIIRFPVPPTTRRPALDPCDCIDTDAGENDTDCLWTLGLLLISKILTLQILSAALCCEMVSANRDHVARDHFDLEEWVSTQM